MFQQSTESVQFEEGETSCRLYALLFFVEQYHYTCRTFTDWKQNANLLTSIVYGLAYHGLYMYTTNSASAAIYLTSAISVAPVKSSVLKQVCLLHVRKAEV